ncbi:type II toxin-antitoxin system prevent-host-death family antitoxin [Fulvimarina sp. 2208YS6-2-32]|uniref:Antitoxin n=1 Tax=Fulvimarina uroteuthidis TaxID=3098149 RepID=A0ABU5I208_9HYPH|nr:type II toxin-antitoxin system prevent-host-death family antitoxin [Fulvimarina sp. 2208YS6-2-32]MDY8108864.1 type II toxin-antitoxin system prevent-host-death family antitoxin [Fulvimarina sp. 2208YS6-2-32]
MKTLNLRNAKATFSAVVDAAAQGEPTVITKHGRPAAMIVPIEDGRRIFPDNKPSFADLLLSMPHELEIERDQTPTREVDL